MDLSLKVRSTWFFVCSGLLLWGEPCPSFVVNCYFQSKQRSEEKEREITESNYLHLALIEAVGPHRQHSNKTVPKPSQVFQWDVDHILVVGTDWAGGVPKAAALFFFPNEPTQSFDQAWQLGPGVGCSPCSFYTLTKPNLTGKKKLTLSEPEMNALQEETESRPQRLRPTRLLVLQLLLPKVISSNFEFQIV